MHIQWPCLKSFQLNALRTYCLLMGHWTSLELWDACSWEAVVAEVLSIPS
jgi:DNA-binding transcriptional regulator/RsmH inhibitor MraZ